MSRESVNIHHPVEARTMAASRQQERNTKGGAQRRHNPSLQHPLKEGEEDKHLGFTLFPSSNVHQCLQLAESTWEPEDKDIKEIEFSGVQSKGSGSEQAKD